MLLGTRVLAGGPLLAAIPGVSPPASGPSLSPGQEPRWGHRVVPGDALLVLVLLSGVVPGHRVVRASGLMPIRPENAAVAPALTCGSQIHPS